MSGLLAPDTVAAAGGIAAGLFTWQLIDIGRWWPEQLLSFAIGAVPGTLLTHLSVDPTEAGKTNLKLVSRSVEMARQSPFTFGIIVIGMTTTLSICYYVFVGVEVSVFLDFLPFLSQSGISVAIVWLGVLASLAWCGIAGWTIEVLEWVIGGFDPKKIPVKPGGRQQWSLTDLPKDLVFFLFAAPIAVVETLMHVVKHRTLVPMLLLPMKIALDQWSRLGDVIVDAFSSSVARTIAHDASKAFDFFDHLFHDLTGTETDSEVVSRIVNRKGGARLVPWSVNHYPTLDEKPSNYWLKYPYLFAVGDNGTTPPTN